MEVLLGSDVLRERHFDSEDERPEFCGARARFRISSGDTTSILSSTTSPNRLSELIKEVSLFSLACSTCSCSLTCNVSTQALVQAKLVSDLSWTADRQHRPEVVADADNLLFTLAYSALLSQLIEKVLLYRVSFLPFVVDRAWLIMH